jgi:hypothetical protein
MRQNLAQLQIDIACQLAPFAESEFYMTSIFILNDGLECVHMLPLPPNLM